MTVIIGFITCAITGALYSSPPGSIRLGLIVSIDISFSQILYLVTPPFLIVNIYGAHYASAASYASPRLSTCSRF